MRDYQIIKEKLVEKVGQDAVVEVNSFYTNCHEPKSLDCRILGNQLINIARRMDMIQKLDISDIQFIREYDARDSFSK